MSDEDLTLTNSNRVVLISLEAIVIIDGSDENGSSHVIDLKDFFNERAKTDPCPVYDIKISGQDAFSKMDRYYIIPIYQISMLSIATPTH